VIKKVTYAFINATLFLCVLLLMVLTVYSTIMRYILRAPDVRSYFISIWLWGIIFLLGFGYALYEKSHIRVDVLYTNTAHRTRRIMDIMGLVIGLLCLIIVLPNSLQLAWRSYISNELDSTIPLYSPPIWWYKWLLVFTFILAAIQVSSVIINELKSR
jgi:TRAP-type mannitol/chloroaromatic compound transport system permease small subunit